MNVLGKTLAQCVDEATMIQFAKDHYAQAPDPAFDERQELARAVDLDMVEAGWEPTVDGYLNRVPKARILEAVREAKGEGTAQLLDQLRTRRLVCRATRGS